MSSGKDSSCVKLHAVTVLCIPSRLIPGLIGLLPLSLLERIFFLFYHVLCEKQMFLFWLHLLPFTSHLSSFVPSFCFIFSPGTKTLDQPLSWHKLMVLHWFTWQRSRLCVLVLGLSFSCIISILQNCLSLSDLFLLSVNPIESCLKWSHRHRHCCMHQLCYLFVVY